MAKNKTTATDRDVTEFINTVDNPVKRDDSFRLVELFRSITGSEPKMWGPTIIGFGSYHYNYASGHEGDAPLAGFSPRKDALTLYMSDEFENREELLSQLGKCKTSKACIYVKKLADIDLTILEKIVVNSMAYALKLYPADQ